MSIKVTFACGHETTVGESAETAPVCHCGEKHIARVKARAPRFTGACSGPYATTKQVDPAIVNLTTAGSLRLKEER